MEGNQIGRVRHGGAKTMHAKRAAIMRASRHRLKGRLNDRKFRSRLEGPQRTHPLGTYCQNRGFKARQVHHKSHPSNGGAKHLAHQHRSSGACPFQSSRSVNLHPFSASVRESAAVRFKFRTFVPVNFIGYLSHYRGARNGTKMGRN